MAAADSAIALTNTPPGDDQILGQRQERELADQRHARQQRERRHHGHLGHHLPAHRAARRAGRAAKAELAQPLDDALPHHAGQPERHHQQQEPGQHRQHAQRHQVVVVLALAQMLHRRHVERPVGGFALEAPHQHRLERRRRAGPQPEQQALGPAAVLGVQAEPIDQHGLRHRVLAVLAEILDDADDAFLLARRIGRALPGVRVGALGDDAADRVGVAEHLLRHLHVDQDGIDTGGVVLAGEAAAGQDGHREHAREVVAHAVVQVVDRAPVGELETALPGRVDVGRGEGDRRDLDLRQLAGGGQQADEGVALARPRLHGGGALLAVAGRRRAADVHGPHAVDVVAERLARVDGEVEADQDHDEDDEERAEDLERQQQVLPLAVPDQPHQVAGHREGPPLSASTGRSRAIRHAGYTPEMRPKPIASSTA